jgi:hypothetical protein
MTELGSFSVFNAAPAAPEGAVGAAKESAGAESARSKAIIDEHISTDLKLGRGMLSQWPNSSHLVQALSNSIDEPIFVSAGAKWA